VLKNSSRDLLLFHSEKHYSPSESHMQPPSTPVHVLELFAGIGGLACVWPEAAIAGAIDINRTAADVYRANFPHPYWIREIGSLTAADLDQFQANLWWLSPPCQPFSRRGSRRDISDPRTYALLRIIEFIAECRPDALALENVDGFQQSTACSLLIAQLERCGYSLNSTQLCPSQLGWPNRRPRFYLLASQQPLKPWAPLPRYGLQVSDVIDASTPLHGSGMCLTAETVSRFGRALDRIDELAADTLTACFAGSYGRTHLHAGSYLRVADGYRRFSPREVARLLGFPDYFQLGPTDKKTQWKLLGNSLSLPAVRYVLSHLPAGPSARLPWIDYSPSSSISR
jgi:site-specific DNA-cytosine methylase